MKEYVIITIQFNTLVFNYASISKNMMSFVNSNKFNEDSLFYDLKYYKKNIKKIINLIKSKNIKIIKVKRLVTFKYISELINSLNIECLILDFFSTLDISDYNLFLQCKSLKEIYCYFMSSDIVYKFQEKNIDVNISSTKIISNKFLELHDVDDKDSLYYKKVITINEEYPQLIEDLKEFLRINYKLRAIRICVYSKELINSIVDLVKNDESRNVILFLHQEYDKGNFIVNNFDWLKDLSEKCKENYTCEFRILYANSFIGKNLFKQLTFNNLKLISVFIIYVSFVSLVIIKSYDYVEKMSIASLNNELINNYNKSTFSDDSVLDEYLADEDKVMEEDISEETIKNKYTFENSYNQLKKINSETVAYLVVNNTNISYPVVQHTDNSYYLSRDFYKKKSSTGWVYLDYRNNTKELNDNTIIYGHNMRNGTMFGTLRYVLDSSWRKNKENMIISLDIENKKYKFQIFSAYKVDYTTDYLVTTLETDREKKEFIDLIRNRSSIKSDVSVELNDKILTLSTCTGSSNKRLVVHAVLLKEGE